MAATTEGSLDEVAAFVAVVKHGSFTAAAQTIAMSAPVLSRKIRALELRLKTELLQRTTRHVHLTSAGERFYARVRDIPSLVMAAEEDLLRFQGHIRGHLRLVLASYVAHLPKVTQLLSDFTQQHQDVKLTVEVVSKPNPSQEKAYDIILTGKLPDVNFPDSSVIQKKIFELQGAIFATPAYLDKHGRPEHPSELIEHNCLSYLNRRWSFHDPQGVPFSVSVGGSFTSNDDQMLHRATLAGLGPTYAFPEFFQKEEQKGELVRILEAFTQKSRVEIYAVMPSKTHVPHAARLLMENLEKLKAN